MFKELWKFINAHYAAKRYHLLLGNIQLLIPLFDQQLLNNLPYLQEVLEPLQEIFIKLDALASEFHFRDFLHQNYIEPLLHRLKTLDSNLAETFKTNLYEHIPPNNYALHPYTAYNHAFQKFYVANRLKQKESVNTGEQNKEPDEQLHLDRKKRIKLYESNPAQNLHTVWNDLVLSYIDAQLGEGQILTTNQLISMLDLLEDSLIQIPKTTQASAKSLWHQVFIAQRLLSDKWIIDHFFSSVEMGALIDWWQQHYGHAAGMIMLSVLARAIALQPEADPTVHFDLARRINTDLPKAKSLLLQNYSNKLKEMRSGFRDLMQSPFDPQTIIYAQKDFTLNSIGLLKQFIEQAGKLLGEAPCDFALCALGSTSREDRRPYSDIELVLLYLPKPNVNTAHLQTYLYYLICGVELAIKQCGESHRENMDPTLLQFAGFHLDDSSHLLKKGLMGTPKEIAQKFICNITQTWQAKGHPWLEDESFYSLLSPVVINVDSYGSEQVLAEYKQRIQAYLNDIVTAEDQIQALTKSINLSSPIIFNGLKRREVIGLSCLVDVMQKSKTLLTSLKPSEVVDDIKRAFYKPLAYLALNLKLFYGLSAKHPADIFAEAASKLSWGESQVLQLLQTALSYVMHIQVKLHLQHRHQEERFIWLGVANENNAEISYLSVEEYVGLSLIKDGLLLPLCQWLDAQLSKGEVFKLLEVLPFLLKSYLAKRNESWLQCWITQRSHSLSLIELLEHPLIKVLADFPSPNGWSPIYKQTMCRWLSQLQNLGSKRETACLIEGIPTTKQNVPCYLPQKIITQLFDAKGEFQGNVHDSTQSKVSQIIWQVSGQVNPITFYFKVKAGNEAGLMGREFAVINLHQLLGGPSHIAIGWPLKLTYMSKGGAKVYYCWLSEGIPGKSLANVMQSETVFATFQSQLDMQSYSHLFITHYLTCPEDAQPDNFKVVEQLNENKQILYGLDVGQSFVGTYDEKRKVLTVKSMLYLLESPIEKLLDVHVLNRLMLLEPKAFIQHWQTNIDYMNQLFQSLYEAELKKTKVPKAQWYQHNQLIDLNEEVKRCVQSRLELLLNWLYGYPSLPKIGMRLLKALDKAVAFSYQSLLGKVKTPEDFYKKIDPKAYVKNPHTGKMYSSTTYISIQQQTLTPEQLQRSLDLGEEYFATIDFRKLNNEAEQRYVLALLRAAIQNKKRFIYLNLSGCIVISEQELLELLPKVPALKELHLTDCPKFNVSTLFTILSFKVNEKLVSLFRWDYEVLCPNLKKLSVTVAGEVKVLDIALNLESRKQLLEILTKLQLQFASYLNKLLRLSDNKIEHVQVAAVSNFGQLAACIPEVQIKVVTEKLLSKLVGENWKIYASAISSLRQLVVRLPDTQVKEIIEKLVTKLDDEHWEVRAAAVSSFSQLAARLSETQLKVVIKKLLARLLGDEDWEVRAAAVRSFGQLAALLSEAHLKSVIEKLLVRLNDGDSNVLVESARRLGQLAAWISEEQVKTVIDTLWVRLDDCRSEVRATVGSSLVQLAAYLTDVQVKDLVEKVLASPEHLSSGVLAATISSLGQLAPRLLEAELKTVMDTLLLTLNDWRDAVRAATISSFGLLATRLMEAQLKILIEELLVKLDGLDRDVRVVVIKILGQLAARLSEASLKTVIEKLLTRLNDWDINAQSAVGSSLVQLAAYLTDVQVKDLVEKLLTKLRDDRYIIERAVTASILSQLAAQLSEVQIKTVFETLIARLKEKDQDVQIAVIKSLGQLAEFLTRAQVETGIKKLLAKLDDWGSDIQLASISSLGQLAVWMSEVEVKTVVEILLARLDEKDWQVQVAAIKSLAEIFSTATSLQWLQKSVLQANEEALESLQNSNARGNQAILFKIFSFLDEKPLLQIVPKVSKDWKRWQKVYLQQQAQNMRLRSALTPEENNDSNSDVASENNFNRFLPQ